MSLPCETQHCVNLFITTLMQTLNVTTNWQLQTNMSQQMLKVFVFGFDTCIKTISSLINCLISDVVLHSRLCFNRFSGTFARYLVRDVSHWPPRNASFPSDLTGSFVCYWCIVLTKHQIIDWFNVLSSTWCARHATARLSICCAGFSQFCKRHPFVETL